MGMIYAIYGMKNGKVYVVESDPDVKGEYSVEQLVFHLNFIVDTLGGAASAYIVSREHKEAAASSPPWAPASLQAFPFLFYKISYAEPSEHSSMPTCSICKHLEIPLKAIKIGNSITLCTEAVRRLLSKGDEIYICADIDKIYEQYENKITRLLLGNKDIKIHHKREIAMYILLPEDNHIQTMYDIGTNTVYCYKYDTFEEKGRWISDDMELNTKVKKCGFHCIHCKYYFVRRSRGFTNPLTLETIPDDYLNEAMIVDRDMKKDFDIGCRGLYLKIIKTNKTLFVPYHYAVNNNIEARPITMNEAKRIIKHSKEQTLKNFRRAIERILK